MDIDRRVARRYELTDEDQRLWRPGKGDLLRLRTWDLFDRLLPGDGRVIDVGGGPGAHAAHLAEVGYDVLLIDPVEHHVAAARTLAEADDGCSFEAHVGVARDLPVEEASVDAVLLMGPLYHLVERDDRLTALAEASRVLRSGGVVLAETISRSAWILDASVKEQLDTPGIWEAFDLNLTTGRSQPDDAEEGAFWAYFHRPGELRDELVEAGFVDVDAFAVEGFGWLLGDLVERMRQPDDLLRAIRLTESDPSMLGCSAHVMGVGVKA